MIHSNKLRQSAREAPHCFYCYRSNVIGEDGRGVLLVLAHSNELEQGRGAYFKSSDIHGGILCPDCHDLADGRKGKLPKAEKHEIIRVANSRTLDWWFENGYLTVAA
jgi:hypothetical protein